ncbi:MAG: threonine transporter [Pseudomonas fluorescens]|nr:MAG: threonine transporter [Pseudomonas fluorescens]
MISSNFQIYPFHTYIESGLRALLSLYEAYPTGMSFERLHYYDYISVHTADFEGPQSLHASFPHRSGEYLVRRELVEQGLEYMRVKGLISVSLSPRGIEYILTDNAGDYILSLNKPYIDKLKIRIKWVHYTFSDTSTEKLRDVFSKKLGKWDNLLEFQSIGKA